MLVQLAIFFLPFIFGSQHQTTAPFDSGQLCHQPPPDLAGLRTFTLLNSMFREKLMIGKLLLFFFPLVDKFAKKMLPYLPALPSSVLVFFVRYIKTIFCPRQLKGSKAEVNLFCSKAHSDTKRAYKQKKDTDTKKSV